VRLPGRRRARPLPVPVRRILSLPPDARLFACHDHAPGGRAFAWESTVAVQRADNIHIHDGIDEDAFAAMRSARDRTLSPPDLILPAIQINIRAGGLPPMHAHGFAYLKSRLTQFDRVVRRGWIKRR